MSAYLGLDCSTQSLTAMIVEADGSDRRVAFEHAIAFDDEFPEYGTSHGVFRHADPLVVTSSPLMWADALDRMMAIVSRESGFDLSQLRAVSGSGQQHGSVYFNRRATAVLGDLDPRQPLARQLHGIFAREDAPVWMDASTTAQCEAIERALGGPDAVARLTGSRAFERFTGPQIRKMFEQDPDRYQATDRIHLVSSYLATLLTGAHAPLDPGDGSGMNLMDIARRQWAPAALAATAPELEGRLPVLVPSSTVIGSLAPYWRERYGFPRMNVVVWSGDNPCSLIGTGLIEEGRIAISLGTSDTLFGLMRTLRIDPSGASHVFGAPTGDYMSLVCFRNGSLARERVRNAHGLDWNGFSRALANTPPGNRGAIMLPWFEPEITPPVREASPRRFGLESGDAASEIRAVVEGQMMAMALHSAWTGVRVAAIRATGGASANREILQVMADVFDADVYPFEGGNSACLGAALRALHADSASGERPVTWPEVVAKLTDPPIDRRVSPLKANIRTYASLKRIYADRVAEALEI